MVIAHGRLILSNYFSSKKVQYLYYFLHMMYFYMMIFVPPEKSIRLKVTAPYNFKYLQSIYFNIVQWKGISIEYDICNIDKFETIHESSSHRIEFKSTNVCSIFSCLTIVGCHHFFLYIYLFAYLCFFKKESLGITTLTVMKLAL